MFSATATDPIVLSDSDDEDDDALMIVTDPKTGMKGHSTMIYTDQNSQRAVKWTVSKPIKESSEDSGHDIVISLDFLQDDIDQKSETEAKVATDKENNLSANENHSTGNQRRQSHVQNGEHENLSDANIVQAMTVSAEVCEKSQAASEDGERCKQELPPDLILDTANNHISDNSEISALPNATTAGWSTKNTSLALGKSTLGELGQKPGGEEFSSPTLGGTQAQVIDNSNISDEEARIEELEENHASEELNEKVDYMQSLALSPANSDTECGLRIISTVSLAGHMSALSTGSVSIQEENNAAMTSWHLQSADEETSSQASTHSSYSGKLQVSPRKRGRHPYGSKRKLLDEALQGTNPEVTSFSAQWNAKLEDLDPAMMVVYKAGQKCPIPNCQCPTYFQSCSSMDKHYQARHVPEWRRCVCKLCESVQVNGGDMKRHLIKVHGKKDVGARGQCPPSKYCEFRVTKTRHYDNPGGIWIGYKNLHSVEKKPKIERSPSYSPAWSPSSGLEGTPERRKKTKKISPKSITPKGSSFESERPDVLDQSGGGNCAFCGKYFARWNSLTMHIAKKHKNMDGGGMIRSVTLSPGRSPISQERIPLTTAGEINDTSEAFRNDIINHREDVANAQETANAHKSRRLNNEGGNCPICGKYFNTYFSLNMHKGWHTRHANGSKGRDKEVENRHSNKEVLHKCEQCSKESIFPDTPGKVFCNFCHAELKAPSLTLIHTGPLWQSKKKKRSVAKKSTKPVKVRAHKCTQCERSFSHEDLLALHMRTHTGWSAENSTFRCSQCSKEFSLKYLLDSHMKVHQEKSKNPTESILDLGVTPGDKSSVPPNIITILSDTDGATPPRMSPVACSSHMSGAEGKLGLSSETDDRSRSGMSSQQSMQSASLQKSPPGMPCSKSKPLRMVARKSTATKGVKKMQDQSIPKKANSHD